MTTKTVLNDLGHLDEARRVNINDAAADLLKASSDPVESTER